MQAYHQTPAVSAGTASKSSRAGAAASYPAIGRAIRLGEFSQIRDWLATSSCLRPDTQRSSTVAPARAQLFPQWLSFIGSLDAMRRERLGSASSTNVSAALPATATTARDVSPSSAAVAAGIAQAADEVSWRRLQAWNEELLSSQGTGQQSPGSPLCSVVLGAACLRGGGKPDMQDRHVTLHGFTSMAATGPRHVHNHVRASLPNHPAYSEEDSDDPSSISYHSKQAALQLRHSCSHASYSRTATYSQTTSSTSAHSSGNGRAHASSVNGTRTTASSSVATTTTSSCREEEVAEPVGDPAAAAALLRMHNDLGLYPSGRSSPEPRSSSSVTRTSIRSVSSSSSWSSLSSSSPSPSPSPSPSLEHTSSKTVRLHEARVQVRSRSGNAGTIHVNTARGTTVTTLDSSRSAATAGSSTAASRRILHTQQQEAESSAASEQEEESQVPVPSIPEWSAAAGVPSSLVAVFDGHSGSRAASVAALRLPTLLASDLSLAQALGTAATHPSMRGRPLTEHVAEVVSSAVRSAFLAVENEILSVARTRPPADVDGTTALLGLQVGEHLILANAGDCRAVLCRGGHALRLTCDHTPDMPEERARIEGERGIVHQVRGVWRVVRPLGVGMGAKICAVSRGLGDLDFKEPVRLLTPEPEVTHVTLQPGTDQFVVYGSDGLWSVLTDEEVVSHVSNILSEMLPYPSSDSSGCESSIEDGGTPNSSAWRRSSMAAGAAAASLVELARLRGSRDDITANISLFHWAPDQYSAAAAGPMNGQRAAGGSSDQDDGDCPFEGTGAAFAGGCDGHASQQE